MPFIELDLIFRYTLGEEKPLSCNGGILNRKYRLGTSQHILGIREGKSLAPSRHDPATFWHLLLVVFAHHVQVLYRLKYRGAASIQILNTRLIKRFKC